MYWDGGEDLHVGRALDNYVSFTVQLTWQAPVRRPRPAQPQPRRKHGGGPAMGDSQC